MDAFEFRLLAREVIAEAWRQILRQSAHEPQPLPSLLKRDDNLEGARWPSLETLWERPAVEPDRSTYARPEASTVADVAEWMVYQRSEAWGLVSRFKVRHAAVYWLALRERVTGQVLS